VVFLHSRPKGEEDSQPAWIKRIASKGSGSLFQFLPKPHSNGLPPMNGCLEKLQIPNLGPAAAHLWSEETSGGRDRRESRNYSDGTTHAMRTITLIPASLCGPRMYSYCSMFKVKLSPNLEPVEMTIKKMGQTY
jgi:hypothetical protein